VKRDSANNHSEPLKFYLKHNFQIKRVLHQIFALVNLKFSVVSYLIKIGEFRGA